MHLGGSRGVRMRQTLSGYSSIELLVILKHFEYFYKKISLSPEHAPISDFD